MSQKDVINILETYIRNLIRSGIPIQKAYLYGSYVRGEADEESDIDILLLSDAFDKSDDELKAKTWSLELRGDHRIEPYSSGLNKFLTDEYSPLFEIVRQEGIEIKVG